MKTIKLSFFTVFLSFILIACGGGSDGDDDESSPVVRVTLNAASFDEGTVVNVTPTVTNEAEVTSFSWAQDSGPSVSFAISNKTLSFTAPLVDEDTSLSFTLRTSLQNGSVLSNQVVVTINNLLQATVISASYNSGLQSSFLDQATIVMLANGNEFTASSETDGIFTFEADLRALPANTAVLFAVKEDASSEAQLLSFVGTNDEIVDNLNAVAFEVINYEVNAFSVAETALTLGDNFSPSFAEIRAARSNLNINDAINLATGVQRYFNNSVDFTIADNATLYDVLVSSASRSDFNEQARSILDDSFNAARTALLADLSQSQITEARLYGDHFFIALDGLSGLGKLRLESDNTGVITFAEISYSGSWFTQDDDIIFDTLSTYSPATGEYVENAFANDLVYTIDLFSASAFVDYTRVTLSRKSSNVTNSDVYIKKTPLSFTRSANIPRGEYLITYFDIDANPVINAGNIDPSGDGQFTEGRAATELAILTIDDAGYTLSEPGLFTDNAEELSFSDNTASVQDADLLSIDALHGPFSLGFHDTTNSLALGITYEGFTRTVIRDGSSNDGQNTPVYLDNILPSANSGIAIRKDSESIDASLRGFYAAEVFAVQGSFVLTTKVFQFNSDGTAVSATWLDRNANGVVDEGEWLGDEFGSVTWSYSVNGNQIKLVERQCDLAANSSQSTCNSYISETWRLWQSSSDEGLDRISYLQNARLIRKNADAQTYFSDGRSRVGTLRELATAESF
ncbi:hypothetical protein ISG33_07375 [Glaciecola sp. MH2013]|uniref:hypothetical protein n=1 Tax=Glaciecola sp. MH2013 TaxID=2785524 RepID=UPI0018A087C3|nr:hypothetical protein [Glaciecola sp. MH2013]MBF7073215.1 hypothetical protein [Glaciecola sp. MH2013]